MEISEDNDIITSTVDENNENEDLLDVSTVTENVINGPEIGDLDSSKLAEEDEEWSDSDSDVICDMNSFPLLLIIYILFFRMIKLYL